MLFHGFISKNQKIVKYKSQIEFHDLDIAAPVCYWQTVFRSSRFKIGSVTAIFPRPPTSTLTLIIPQSCPQHRQWRTGCHCLPPISAANGRKIQRKMRTECKSCSFQNHGKNSRKGGDFHGLSKKEKSSKPAWLLDFPMAERVGFEPT